MSFGRLDMRFRCLTTIPSLPSLPSRGFRPEDEEGQSQRNWDGVDCGLYYGAATIKDSARIESTPPFCKGGEDYHLWTILE